jgi:methylated-DNA-[protein]-cysteine S-methyltransferase
MKATLDRLAERASAEGLLDVAYTTTDSPFGTLLLAATGRGLVRVGLPNQDEDELLADLAARVSPRVLETAAPFEAARRELDLYFEGALTEFDLPLDWRLSKDFRRRVLRAPATSGRSAPPAPPAAPTRCPSSSPATASCAAAAPSAAMAAACR